MMQWLIGQPTPRHHAFFLAAGIEMSADTLAIQSMRARVMALLDANFHDVSLAPKTIAKACGISRSYLYKVFAERPSVMEHRRCRRLDAALGLIERRCKDLSITSVAMACGFSSSSEFSRLFKEEFGIKPSLY
jgi:AraC-like DNA-binding protein